MMLQFYICMKNSLAQSLEIEAAVWAALIKQQCCRESYQYSCGRVKATEKVKKKGEEKHGIEGQQNL